MPVEPPPGNRPDAPGPIGGYGVGLPPGVSPDAVHGAELAGSGQTEPMALTSLALAIAGLLLSLCCVGIPFSVAAVALGIIALTRIKPDGPSGRGMAITGIVLGVLGPLLYVGLQLVGAAFSFWHP